MDWLRNERPVQFNPISNTLFTDKGELIKELSCPLKKRWQELKAGSATPHRSCPECDKQVLDTSRLSDSEILEQVKKDPSTCLSVRAGQTNVSIRSFIQGVRDQLKRP